MGEAFLKIIASAFVIIPLVLLPISVIYYAVKHPDRWYFVLAVHFISSVIFFAFAAASLASLIRIFDYSSHILLIYFCFCVLIAINFVLGWQEMDFKKRLRIGALLGAAMGYVFFALVSGMIFGIAGGL